MGKVRSKTDAGGQMEFDFEQEEERFENANKNNKVELRSVRELTTPANVSKKANGTNVAQKTGRSAKATNETNVSQNKGKSAKNTNETNVAERSEKSAKVATPLMKMVAEKSYSHRNAKKVFTSEEIREIIRRRESGDGIEPEEQAALKEKYRKIKRRVYEMEKANQEKVIVFPSLTNGEGWYKALNFSALYYAYRLADRMGRSAKVVKDSDRFSKAEFVVSIKGIEKFVEQFKRFEEPKIEIAEDGVYIFTLKKPLTDDEVGQLRLVENTRRERMHNVLRPKQLDPATFNAIMMIDRQIVPRIKKLEKPYFNSIGCRMVTDLHEMLAIYNQFADGIYDRKEAGPKLLALVDDLVAGLTLIAELRIWPYDTSARVGENVNQVKQLIIKGFNLQIGKVDG